MCKERASFLTLVVPLIVALAVIFFASSSQLVYAKGAQKSGDARDNASSSGPSSSNSHENSNDSNRGNSNSNSSNNSSNGNSSYQPSRSNESRSDNSSSYRRDTPSEPRREEPRRDPPVVEQRREDSSNRSSQSNQYRQSESSKDPVYRPESKPEVKNDSRSGSSSYGRDTSNETRPQDDSRHKPPVVEQRRGDTPQANQYRRQTETRKDNSISRPENSRPESKPEIKSESRSGSSVNRSDTVNKPTQQDDPRHKPPGGVTREPQVQNRSESGRTPTPPSATLERNGAPSSRGLKGYLTRSEPARIQDRSEIRPSSSPAGAYRKDYSDLGQIWRSRRESVDSSRNHDGSHGSRTDIHVNINYFPGHYNYYTYDYRPGFAYPSLYCYYYGLFPPYIFSHRVYYVHRVFPVVVFVEIPIAVFYYDTSYYDSYYSTGWRYRSLSAGLRDIERAWGRQDIDLLMDHVRDDTRIDISLKGEYAYSVDRQDYYDMTLDAMNNIRTVSFEFYNVRWHDGREAIAYGKHVYYDDSDSDYGDRRTVYLKYRLEKSVDDWYITEVGTSPSELY